MKTLAALAFVTAIWAGLSLAHARHTSLVKGSPTNYGTNGFDISSVDTSTQKYYLGDRTNNAIDLVDVFRRVAGPRDGGRGRPITASTSTRSAALR